MSSEGGDRAAAREPPLWIPQKRWWILPLDGGEGDFVRFGAKTKVEPEKKMPGPLSDSPETASSASIEILEPATGGAGRHSYVVTVIAASGGPAPAGEELMVTLEGGGSLAPTFPSNQIRRETDTSGQARFTWYRRSIYDRDIQARLVVTSSNPGYSVSIQETTAEASNTSYDLPGKSKWRF
jgi:hypothetical protein